jgi:type I restriction enzyme S subunit
MNKGLTKISEIILEISMGPFGSDIKVDNFVESGVPVLNGANLSKFKLLEEEFRYVTIDKAKTFRKAIAKRGDIVITHRGTLGQISYIPENSKFEEYVISQSQFRVALNKKLVDPAFFVYYFHTNEGQKRLLANKCHVGVPALAQATTNFRLIEIPLPNIQTQHKIASVLSILDSKIELNNRINAELEAMAKTLYDYWFVQFEFPIEDGKPYKSSGGKMVWNEELKKEVPKVWEVKSLGNTGNFKNGVNYDPSNPGEIACPIINVRNISKSRFFLKNEDLDIIYLRESDVRKYSVHSGSIIIARSGIPGATRLISDMADNTLYCGFAIHYELEDLNLKIPVFFFLKSIEQNIQSGSGGTILKNVNQATLNDLKIVLPKEDYIISEFNLRINPIFGKINLIQKENQKLAELRDWLLPMLMNGQVMVSEL